MSAMGIISPEKNARMQSRAHWMPRYRCVRKQAMTAR